TSCSLKVAFISHHSSAPLRHEFWVIIDRLCSNQKTTAARHESSVTPHKARNTPFQLNATEILAMLSPARTPPRYPIPSIMPEKVALPCLPPKSSAMAPAR